MTPTLLIALLLLPAAPDPGIEAQYLHGLTQLEEGRHDAAIATFRAVVEEHPDDPAAPGALLKWAETEEARGDLDAAIDLFDRLVEAYPSHRLARTAADRSRILGDRVHRDEVEAHYLAILESFSEAGFADSAAAMEALIADHPTHPVIADAECWLGRQYRVAGDDEAAQAHYLEAFRLTDDRPPCEVRALQDLARIALDEQDFATADEYYEALAALGPEQAEAAEELRKELKLAHGKERAWQAMQFLAALSLLGLFWGYPWRHVRMHNVGAGLAGGGALVVAVFVIGIFCSPETRALLVPLGAGFGSLALIHGIRRGLPAGERHRKIYPIALVWLLLTVAFGSLYMFGRI